MSVFVKNNIIYKSTIAGATTTITVAGFTDGIDSIELTNTVVHDNKTYSVEVFDEYFPMVDPDNDKDNGGKTSLKSIIIDGVKFFHTIDVYKDISTSFKDFQKLTSVTIKNVKKIEPEVFKDNKYITTVAMHNVEEVGTRAFTNSSVQTVTLSVGNDKIKKIDLDKECFQSCKALTSLTWAADTQYTPNLIVYPKAFQYCTSLNSFVWDQCTTIQDQAFDGCWGITDTLTLKNTTSIGDGAFMSCESIKGVKLQSCNGLGRHAFAGCANMTKLQIIDDSTISSIPFGCFEGCYKLTTVELPSIQQIQSHAFQNCQALNFAAFNFENIKYVGIDAFKGTTNYEYDATQTLKILKVKNLILESDYTNVTTFPDQINHLSDNDEEDSVTIIADGSFANHFDFQSITLPSSIKSIGNSAFFNCHNVESITFDGTLDDWKKIRLGAEWNYNIPAMVVTMKDNTQFIIKSPKNSEIWYQTSDNTKCEVDTSLSGLSGNNGGLGNGNSILYFTPDYDQTINFGKIVADPSEEMYHIRPTLFTGKNLKCVYLPSSVKYISDDAFAGQQYLETISELDVYEIGEGAFENCYKLTDIKFGHWPRISDNAFSNCTELKTLTFTTSQYYSQPNPISGTAFQNCDNLTDIIFELNYSQSDLKLNKALIEAGLTVPRTIMENGIKKTEVTLDEDHDVDFFKYSTIEKVFIPDGYILENPSNVENFFLGCYALKAITGSSEITTSNLQTGQLFPLANALMVVIQGGEYADYRVVSGCSSTDIYGWQGCYDRIDQITDKAFYGITNFAASEWTGKVTLNLNGCPTIGNYAFYNCTDIQEVKFVNIQGALSIGEYAFCGCSGITKIYLYKSADKTTIGTNAFTGCSGIKEIYFDLKSEEWEDMKDKLSDAGLKPQQQITVTCKDKTLFWDPS